LSEPHDLIGVSKLDLETRIFSEQWKAMKIKPVEYRTLVNPTTRANISQVIGQLCPQIVQKQLNMRVIQFFFQGKLELWVEILTSEQALAIPM
jgi:hypothetical protein